MATNLAAMTGALVRYAETRGLDGRRVLDAAGIDAGAIAPESGRVACEADTAAWDEVERQLGDPDLGLALAESWDAATFGVVGAAAMSSRTVGEAIARSVRFSRLIKDDMLVQIVPRGRSFLVAATLPRGHRPWSRAIADSWLATYVVFASRWSGEAVRVAEAHFAHAAPRDTSAYERLLGGPVSFGRPVTAIVLDRAVWELPLRTARVDAGAHLEARAGSALEGLRRRDALSDVRDAVRASVDDGDVRVARVARRLATSARTLQRRLAEERIAFRQIVDDTRCAMALPLVAFTATPVGEIGERLGYADAKAFRRAFRRWTGMAPNDARALRASTHSETPAIPAV